MIEKFKQIFQGLDRAHGVTIVGESNGNGTKVKGKSFVKREPVTDELWQKHLDGDSLGVIPINDENKCKWGCIDIDSYAGFDHQKLINKIKQFKFTTSSIQIKIWWCTCIFIYNRLRISKFDAR